MASTTWPVTLDPLRNVSPLPSGTSCMTVAIMVAPLSLLSDRKAEFKLTGRMVPAGIGSADRVFCPVPACRYIGNMHSAKPSILRLFFILFLLKEFAQERVVLPHHLSLGDSSSLSDSLCRTDGTRFYSAIFLGGHGNKTPVRWFTLVCMSERTCHRSRSSG